MNKHYVYILRCSDDSLYTGTSVDLNSRVRRHNNGKGSKYTRTRLPVKLIYFESHRTLVDARRREREIKGWRREKKLKLVKKN